MRPGRLSSCASWDRHSSLRAPGALRVARALLVAAALLVSAGSPFAGPPQGAPGPAPGAPVPDGAAASGVIRGRVVRADTGEPLRGVRIETSGPDGPVRFTDAGGRFELTGLRAARHAVTASKGGYVAHPSDRTARSATSTRAVELAAGQVIEDLDLALHKGSVIAGRVIDERGRNVTGALVAVLRAQWLRGQAGLNTTGAVNDHTDDRGEFRLFDLPAGAYLLAVDAEDPGGAGRVTAYYPAASSPAEAQWIALRPGEDLIGVTIALVNAPGGSVSGVVRTADGRPPAATSVYVTPVASQSFSQGSIAPVRPDGSYAFPALPAGEYMVSASSSPPDPGYASARVTLSGADLVVPLTLRPGDTLRGRFVFDTGAPPSDLRPSAVRASIEQADLAGAASLGLFGRPPATRDDWTFEIPQLFGHWRVRANVPAGWAVARVRVGSADVTDVPLPFEGADVNGVEIVLTQRIARLSGIVALAGGAPADGATVVVFAEDVAQLWPGTRFIGRARANAGGRFTLNGLPPARYLAAAVESLEPGEETNPALLERLRPAATAVALDVDTPAMLDLALTDLP